MTWTLLAVCLGWFLTGLATGIVICRYEISTPRRDKQGRFIK